MSERELLVRLKKILEDANMPSTLEKSPEPNQLPKLILPLGPDAKNRERVMEVTAQEQILLPEMTKKGNLALQKEYARIQFQTALPFSANSSTAIDIASMAHFINRLLELPGIEFSEFDHKLYYRYVLLTTMQGVTQDLLLAIIGNILMFLDFFSDPLEKVADGTMSFNELLEQIIAMSQNLPKGS